MSRKILIGVWMAILCVAACRGPREESTKSRVPRAGGRLTVAERATPTTFNYPLATSVITVNISYYLMNSRLIEFNHQTQQNVAGLAESWDLAPDGKSLTCRLRPSLAFSDGAPLTADDVLFTLRVLTDEKLNSLFRDALLVNGKNIQAQKIDDRTIRLDLPEPIADPADILANLGVLPRHKLSAAFESGAFENAWGLEAKPEEFAVSGPFMLKEYVPGQRTILVRNPHYWKKDAGGTQLPYLDELVIDAIADPNTAILKFQQGGIDLLDGIRPADYASLKDQPGATVLRDAGPWLQPDLFWFNLSDAKDAKGKPLVDPARRSWFIDPRFRKAIAHAIDRNAIVANVLRGLGTPIDSFVTPGNKIWLSEKRTSYAYDPGRSRSLLQEAGFQFREEAGQPRLLDSSGRPVEFTLIVSESVAPRKQMAVIMQEDLAKIGIKVNLTALEDKMLEEFLTRKFSYDAAIHGVSPSGPDPSAWTAVLRSDGNLHFWAMKQSRPQFEWETRFDQLLAEMAASRDPAERKRKFDEIQQLFAEQLPMIPLVARHFLSGARASLGNYQPSFLPPRSLWNAEELFISPSK